MVFTSTFLFLLPPGDGIPDLRQADTDETLGFYFGSSHPLC